MLLDIGKNSYLGVLKNKDKDDGRSSQNYTIFLSGARNSLYAEGAGALYSAVFPSG